MLFSLEEIEGGETSERLVLTLWRTAILEPKKANSGWN